MTQPTHSPGPHLGATREPEIRTLAEWHQSGVQFVSIVGLPGTGRSHLLACCRHDERFAINVFDVAATGEASGSAIRTELDTWVREHQASADETNLILAFDNLDSSTADPDLTAWIASRADSWCAGPIGAVWVAGAEPVGLAGEQVLRLLGLAKPAGVELYHQTHGQRNPGHSDEEATLCELCGGHPLTLVFTAGKAPLYPASAFFEGSSLQVDMLRSPAKDGPIDRLSSIWNSLPAELRQNLVSLAFLEGSFDVKDISELFGSTVVASIEALWHKSWLQLQHPGQFALAPLAKQFVRCTNEYLEKVGCDGRAADNHAAHFRAVATHWQTELYGGQAASAMRRFERCRNDMLLAARTLLGKAQLGSAEALAAACETLTALAHAESLATRPGQELFELFDALQELGNEQQCLRIELERLACLKARREQVRSLSCAEAVMLSAKRQGLTAVYNRALCYWAEILIETSQPGKVHARIEQLESIAQTESPLCARAAYLAALCRHSAGETRPQMYQRAIRLAQTSGDVRIEERALLSEAARLQDQGAPERAVWHARRSMERATELGAWRRVGLARLTIAELEAVLENFEVAAGELDLAREAFERANFVLGPSFVGYCRARLQHLAGELDEAAELYERIIDSPQLAQGPRTLFALAHASLGTLQWQRSRFAASSELFSIASEAVGSSGDLFVTALCRCLHVLGARLDVVEQTLQLIDWQAAALLGGEKRALLLALAARCRGQEVAAEQAQLSRSFDLNVRVFAPLLQHHSASDVEQGRSKKLLRIGSDSKWLEVAGERVDLRRRHSIRRVLQALVDAHSAGTTLGVYELLDLGWPDNKIGAESGANRVYWAVATLRELGLGSWLETNDEGYLLASDVRIERITEAAPS